MILLRQKITILLSMSLALVTTGICQNTNKERLAVLPFTIEGLSADESSRLQHRFTLALQETNRFDILSEAAQKNSLAQAGLQIIDSCNTTPCLAQLGRVLHVQKIVHVNGLHAGQRYILQLRLVDAEEAKLVYDDAINFAGDFGQPLFDAFADMAAKMTKAHFSMGTPWYYIAAAVLVGVAGLYWLFATWASSSAFDTGGSPSTPTTR